MVLNKNRSARGIMEWNSMFELTATADHVIVIFVKLPEGQKQDVLVNSAKEEIRKLLPEFYGQHVRLNGRITTGMALVLGHELAHVCKSVSIFDPKENSYVLCVTH